MLLLNHGLLVAILSAFVRPLVVMIMEVQNQALLPYFPMKKNFVYW
jgi:hypothetical protein|tara:strand:- start:228 stop:365 length:138 start_codon:yes stop_codon:yes gene_type:complete